MITCGTTPDRNVTNPLTAQKEASTIRTKKTKPPEPPASPTAKKVMAAKATERKTSGGKATMALDSV
jgi:hypothetical protein